MQSMHPFSQHSSKDTQLSSEASTTPQLPLAKRNPYAGHSSAWLPSMTATTPTVAVEQFMPRIPLQHRSMTSTSSQLLVDQGKLSTSLWEEEGTVCYHVDAHSICVARRADNDMINGTKLLNVTGMSRGKRDGILKNEKGRVVVKVGTMHLKGVWVTFSRAKALATQFNILDILYPLFADDPTLYFCPPPPPPPAALTTSHSSTSVLFSNFGIQTTQPPTLHDTRRHVLPHSGPTHYWTNGFGNAEVPSLSTAPHAPSMMTLSSGMCTGLSGSRAQAPYHSQQQYHSQNMLYGYNMNQNYMAYPPARTSRAGSTASLVSLMSHSQPQQSNHRSQSDKKPSSPPQTTGLHKPSYAAAPSYLSSVSSLSSPSTPPQPPVAYNQEFHTGITHGTEYCSDLRLNDMRVFRDNQNVHYQQHPHPNQAYPSLPPQSSPLPGDVAAPLLAQSNITNMNIGGGSTITFQPSNASSMSTVIPSMQNLLW